VNALGAQNAWDGEPRVSKRECGHRGPPFVKLVFFAHRNEGKAHISFHLVRFCLSGCTSGLKLGQMGQRSALKVRICGCVEYGFAHRIRKVKT
jgi:hypothetical protein